MTGAARSAEIRAAREGRVILAEALGALQQAGGSETPGAVIESIAAASSTLFELERAEPGSAEYRSIRGAVGHLAQALSALQALPSTDVVAGATECVARALALLYPLARSHQRRRRQVILDIFGDADVPSGARAVPEPTGQAPEPHDHDFDGQNRRRVGERTFVEIDIGLVSESHFYAGLSRDISRGGVFVATYDPKPPGTPVTLYLVLPSGRSVSAKGIVRWTVKARGGLPPGMGVAFDDLSPEDLQAIADFCASRAPLYHDQADD